MLPAQPNQSLIDGLACLQELASHGKPIGGRAMARALGLEPTRVNRLLRTLAHLGLAEQDERRKYRPGPAIHVLAAQSLLGSGLLRRAAPELERLRRHGLVVALGVLWRDQVAYLYHASPDTPAGGAIGRVGLFPANQSGLGVALLAGWKNPQIATLYPDAAERRTLMSAVRAARQRGYALVRRDDSATIGVRLAGATDAAIGLAGALPARRVAGLAEALAEAAARITAPEAEAL